MSNIKALTECLVVTPTIRIWSGQVTLKREHLTAVTGLPPRSLVSDGAMRIIDPKALTQLESQRRCVNRDLGGIGLKTDLGFLINPAKEAEVIAEMESRKAKFLQARDQLSLDYDVLCTKWETENPGFEALLKRHRPSAATVTNACRFGYSIHKIVPMETEAGLESFAEAAKAATTDLAEDIASNARQILKDSFEGRESVTQRAVNVVRQLVDKLKGFTMFDPRIAPTTDALESVLGGLPKHGPLDTTQTLILGAMLKSMTDASTLLNLGSGTSASDETEDADEGIAPDATQPAATGCNQTMGTAVLF